MPASSVPFGGDDESLEGFEEAPAAPTVFVTDPSVEAARLEWALRARGFTVIDVPLAMLVGRVAVQKPDVVVLDVDAPGALDVATRVRGLPGGAALHLVYVGAPGRTLSSAQDAYAHDGSGFSPRPLDVEALVAKIDALVGSERGSAPSMPIPSSMPPPPSLRAPMSPPPPRPISAPPQTGAPGSQRATTAAAAALPALPPPGAPNSDRPPSNPAADPAIGAASLRGPEARLSPDLERLLREAEARVVGPGSARARSLGGGADYDEVLSPEQEVEAVLPAEILASLEEPLDDSGVDEGSSGTGGGTPRGSTNRGGRGESVDATPRPGRTGAATTGAQGRGATGGANAPTNAGAFGEASAHVGGSVEAPAAPIDPPRAAAALRPEQLETPRPPRRAQHEAREVGPPPTLAALAASFPRPAGPHDAAGFSPVISDVDEGGEQEPSDEGRVGAGLDEPMAASLRADADEVSYGDEVDEPSPYPDAPVLLRGPSPLEAAEHAPPLAAKTSRPPAPEPPPPVAPLPVPASLPAPRAVGSPDEALRTFSEAVALRVSGVMRIDEPAGIRRIVLQDGDVVTAASSVEGESLLGFLVGRGDLPADVAARLEGRIPPFGRLAGAALVAHGHLHKDALWDVLQAHAAFLLVRAVSVARARVSYEAEPPARLRGEPPVFGGTPGPALVVEIVRRALGAQEALARLGGREVRLTQGPRARLLDECGLDDAEQESTRRLNATPLGAFVDVAGEDAPALVYALVALGVLEVIAAPRAITAPPRSPRAGRETESIDPRRDAELDDAGLRARVLARRALVDDGDYFAILGVPRGASGYEIRRAYLEVRRALDPNRLLLRPSLADLEDDLRLLLTVIDEAYDILKEPTRRERYRRAIEGEPPTRG
jgi:hypothetical protein